MKALPLIIAILLTQATFGQKAWDSARYRFVGEDPDGDRFVIDMQSFKRIRNTPVVGFTLWSRDTEMRIAASCSTLFYIAEIRKGDDEPSAESDTAEIGSAMYRAIIMACEHK